MTRYLLPVALAFTLAGPALAAGGLQSQPDALKVSAAQASAAARGNKGTKVRELCIRFDEARPYYLVALEGEKQWIKVDGVSGKVVKDTKDAGKRHEEEEHEAHER